MKKLILTATLLGLAACGEQLKDDDSTFDSDTAIVESGVTAISGAMDDQSGAGFSYQYQKPNEYFASLIMPQARAISCGRAVSAACDDGVRDVSYSSCDISGTQRTASGSVTLTYSNSVCSFAADGDSVTRTYNMAISGPRGGTVNNSSSVKSDYRGTSYGGGGKITKTASGYTLDILGKHKSLTVRDRELFNVSVRSLQALQVTGGLSRSARTLNGGQLEINHNKAGYTALWSPTNLQWNNTCCHPVSGSVAINYSGSKTGSATVTFLSCGQIQLEQNGESKQIELSYCE